MFKNHFAKFYLKIRRFIYQVHSVNNNITGTYKNYQPIILRGKGHINFDANVKFGVINSPRFVSTYAYVEARTINSKISFGNNVNINNDFSATAEKSIIIGDDVLIGISCNITDSNFHDLKFDKRKDTDPNPESVVIKNNVFIGNNVLILKGTYVGENSVIAAGSVVKGEFPSNVIIGGVPAKVLKKIDVND